MVGEVRMSLTQEAITIPFGNQPGDMKIVAYPISFTLHALVEPEPGWFLLNGATGLSTTTYPTLFNLFGHTFGGSGSTFSLPDFTDGKVPLPKGLSNFTTYGATGGEINHVLTSGENPAHTHPDTFSATAGSHNHTGSGSINATNDAHTHTNVSLTSSGSGSVGSGGGNLNSFFDTQTSPPTGSVEHGHTATASVNNATSPNLSISGSITAAGGGASHNNMQPYQVLSGWLVKHD